MTLKYLLYSGFVFLVSLCPVAYSAPPDEVKALIEQGKSAEAYALGREHADALGTPAFDFYFGVAAINSGHAGEGVLALERYVVNVPDDLNGRLELARGYFVLGEDARAREEFSLVLAGNPPPNVAANINRFLDAIRARESQYRPTAAFVLEAGYGYDSNANGGVGNANLVLPNGVGVTLGNAFVRTSQNFLHFLAGASGSRPVTPGVSVFGLATFDARLHDSQTRLDQQNIGAAGGLTVIREKNSYRGTISYYRLYLENDHYRDVGSISGEWQHQLDELQAVNAFVQAADLNYAGVNSLRNSNFYTAGLGYRRAFIHEWQPLLNASVFLGKEDVRSDVRSDLSRDLRGVRVSATFTPAPKWGLAVAASYTESDYDGGDPLPAGFPLLPARRDRYMAADLSASYALTRELSLRGELALSKNESNNPLYEYRRNVAALKLRYEFK